MAAKKKNSPPRGNKRVSKDHPVYRQGSAGHRRELLVDKYFEFNCDKVKAARACGYACVESTISQIFRHPEVVRLIGERQDKQKKKYELNEAWVIERLMKIADVSLGDVIVDMGPDGDLLKLTPEQRYALAEFKQETYVEGKDSSAREVKRTSVKLADKLAALEKLGKRLGLFTDKVKLEASDDLVAALQAGRARIHDEVDREHYEKTRL